MAWDNNRGNNEPFSQWKNGNKRLVFHQRKKEESIRPSKKSPILEQEKS
jgi:hypothetical protein